MPCFNHLLKVLAKAKNYPEGATPFRLSIIMAKVNFGTIANDARGKINGTVYSKNKSGSYVRRKVSPANPNTARQSLVRANFAVLSQAWSGTLSQAERAAWIAYANTYPRLDVFGASINISGLNMFISLNQVLLNLGRGSSTTPPATNVITPIAFDPTTFVATASAGTVIYKQTAVAPTGLENYVFAARPLPPGRTVQRNDFRFLESDAGPTTGFPADFDVGTAYVAKYGAFVAGQNIAILTATVDILTGLTTVGTILQGLAV